MDAEATYNAGLLACAELLLTGCTTTADMAYFYPYGRTDMFDAAVKAASDIGIRFHPCRAAMPAMEADLTRKLQEKGFPVGNFIEDPDLILNECERVIHQYHCPDKFSMCRVAIGQTDKTYRQPGFMRQMADLARQNGVMLHTHLHPRLDEINLCRDLYKIEPIDFLAEHGWTGEDVWFAHATSFTQEYIDRVVETRTGISHSPSSNMRLNYASTPIPALIAAGAKVSVGVDGGASNDSGDYLGELREVLYVHRIRGIHAEPFNSASNTTPYGVLKLGTRGGADVLNRPEIGSLEAGKAADIAIFNLNRVDFAATHDPLAALIMCGISHRVDTTIVNGKILVKDGLLTVLDEDEIANRANTSARRLIKENNFKS